MSEPNYHSNFFYQNYQSFSKNIISNRKEKTGILINKPVYLGLSILKLSKILMYEFWYDYLKTKYGEKAKLCYVDTGIVSLYTEKQLIFRETLQKMLKLDLILKTMN